VIDAIALNGWRRRSPLPAQLAGDFNGSPKSARIVKRISAG
jgi:hypothetical protein